MSYNGYNNWETWNFFTNYEDVLRDIISEVESETDYDDAEDFLDYAADAIQAFIDETEDSEIEHLSGFSKEVIQDAYAEIDTWELAEVTVDLLGIK